MTKDDAKHLTDAELKTKLAFFRTNKIWQGDYFVLDREQQRRATAIWVHEDVFGEPYIWDVEQQKFVVPAGQSLR